MIKKQIKKFKKKILKFRNRRKRNIYLSFGENCLTDRILERHGIKSFSSPYSSGRSNIEYLLQIEEADFADLVNTDYLEYGVADNKRVARNTKYTCENRYDESCMKGFEFTHHDVLGKEEMRKTIKRRCIAMLELKGKHLHIYYHHRLCPETDEERLLADLRKLKAIYESRCEQVTLVMFTQSIVSDAAERRVLREEKNGVIKYTFFTLKPWAGADNSVFWAECDDDLIKTMIHETK